MSARFTETEKWSDPWFQSLPHGSKLLFMYLCDRCNIAGFYEENIKEACFQLGIEERQYKGAKEALGRGVKEANGWLWVKNFLKHQKNKDLNPENAAHRGIIRSIKEQVSRFSEVDEFRGFIAPIEGLLSLTGNNTGKGNGEGGQGKRTVKAPKFEMGSEPYFESLQSNPAYSKLDVRTEYHKCLAYFSPQQVSHKRVLSWLNRADPKDSAKNGNGKPSNVITAAEALKRQQQMDAEQERKANAH